MVIPVLTLSVATISTVKEVYGCPAILQVDYNYTQGAGRIFSKATVYPEAIIPYFLISTLIGFLAGAVFAQRPKA